MGNLMITVSYMGVYDGCWKRDEWRIYREGESVYMLYIVYL